MIIFSYCFYFFIICNYFQFAVDLFWRFINLEEKIITDYLMILYLLSYLPHLFQFLFSDLIISLFNFILLYFLD